MKIRGKQKRIVDSYRSAAEAIGPIEQDMSVGCFNGATPQKGVERSIESHPQPPPDGFNGATPQKGVERLDWPVQTRALTTSFNGATPQKGVESQALGGFFSACRSRFNGATPQKGVESGTGEPAQTGITRGFNGATPQKGVERGISFRQCGLLAADGFASGGAFRRIENERLPVLGLVCRCIIWVVAVQEFCLEE
jgi:hypothetical protein